MKIKLVIDAIALLLFSVGFFWFLYLLGWFNSLQYNRDAQSVTALFVLSFFLALLGISVGDYDYRIQKSKHE
jgi:uncharacterized membrane protein